MIARVSILAVLLTPIAALAQPSPSELPRPSGCVLDEVGILSASTRETIQAECDRVAEGGQELAVVVVATAGSRGPRPYALELFNTWRLGGPDDDDGVLLFAAIDDRAAEIVLGDDLDSPANVARSDRVMAEVIVPAFRRGTPDVAMRDGARYVAANLFSAAGSEAIVTPETEGPERVQLPPPTRRTTRRPRSRPTPSYAYDHRPSPEPGLLSRMSRWFGGYGLWVVFGGLVLVLLIGLRLVARYRPRKCGKCGSPMLRFDEADDDEHLSSGERAEERVGSVDYDVWACQSCDHLIELRYAAIFTSYRKCGGCGARTESSRTRTIRAATEHSTGLAEVTVSCAHCGSTSTHTRVIPKKPPPSQNRSGGTRGGGFSSSSSYRGGGGGHSSGGGSSGRW